MNAFIALLLLAVAPPAAQTSDEGGVAQPKKERLICKKDPTTETRMAKKICKTAAQWKQFQRTGGFDGVTKGN